MLSPYKDEKYVDIKKNEPIIDKLKLAIDIMNNNGCWERYIPETNEIKNVLENMECREPPLPNSDDYLHPIIVGLLSDDIKVINPFITNHENCGLCDYYDFVYDGSRGTHHLSPALKEKIELSNDLIIEKSNIMMNGKVPPNLIKTLKWRNYVIVPNYEPYYKNHFMILSLNHEYGKIVGSQFEVLDYQVLYELLTFYKLNNQQLSFLHNYVHTGSQSHLHIHFLLTEPDIYSFYDQLSNQISMNYEIDYGNDPSNWELSDKNKNLYIYKGDKTVELGIRYPVLDSISLANRDQPVKLNVEFYANADKQIFLCKHTETEFGLNGFLISTSKVWVSQEDNFNKFVSVVHGFLNSIELSLTHSFCQFWTKSSFYLNVYIVTQLRDNITSARALRMDIASSGPIDLASYSATIPDLKLFNNRYLDTRFFNFDIVDNAFKEYILQNKNPIMEGLKYELGFELLRSNQLFIYPYIESALSNKKSQKNPYVFLTVGPYGAGKSMITKNKDIMKKFNVDLSDCLVINIDDIRLNFPWYKNITDKIKHVLKKYELMTFWRLGITLSNPELQTRKVMDLIYDRDSYKDFELDDLITIYKRLFDTVEPELSGETVIEYHENNFYICHSYSAMVYESLIKEATKRKISVLLETCKRDYDAVFIDVNTGYDKYDGYDKYVVMVLVDDSAESKKYIIRNLIQRSFLEGRVIDINEVLNRIDRNRGYNQSYIDNLDEFKNYDYYVLNDKVDIKPIINSIIEYPGSLPLGKIIYDQEEFQDFYRREIAPTRTLEFCREKSFQTKDTGSNTYTFSCIVNDRINTEDFEMPKKKFNDEITNLILKNIIKTDNIRTIMIYDFYVNYKKLIEKYVLRTKIRRDFIDLGINISVSDIKIILKGGSSIRLDIINYLEKIEEIIKSIDNIKDINPNLLTLRYIFKLMLNETDPSKLPSNLIGKIDDYYNTFGKSDIDFAVHLNPDIFVDEEQFNFVLKEIEIIAIKLLYGIRKKYEESDLYAQDDINFLNSFKELFIKSNTDINYTYNGKPISKIFYKKNELTYDVLTQEMSIKTAKITRTKDQLIFNPKIIDGSIDDDIVETVFVDNIIHNDPVSRIYHNYVITFNNTLKKEFSDLNEVVHFDLLRLKLFTKVYFQDVIAGGDKEELDCSGELIDISFLRYRDLDLKIKEDEVKIFNFNYPLYNFSLESYTILKQIEEINKMLFKHILNIWNVKKYNKRLNRFVVLIMLYLMKTDSLNIQYYIKFFKKLSKLIDQDISQPNIQRVYEFIEEEQNLIIQKLLTPFKNYYKRNITTYLNFLTLKRLCISSGRTLEEFNTQNGFTQETNDYTREYVQLAIGLNNSVEVTSSYINKWEVSYKLFEKTIKSKFEFLYSSLAMLNSLFFITTQKINKIDDTNISKWGGGIKYDSIEQELYTRSGLAPYAAKFDTEEYKTIDIFFNVAIQKIMIRFRGENYKITENDVKESSILNAGSFGYGLRIRATNFLNSLDKKNMVIKIIPVKQIGFNTANTNLFIKLLTKESFIGYKLSKLAITARDYNIFNENYALFSFYKENVQDYVDKLSDNIEFQKIVMDNIFLGNSPRSSLTDAQKDILREGKVSFLLMNGGIADTSSLYYATLILKTNNIFKNLSKCINQLMCVHNLCYKEYNNITYITHNDIKPGNMIYGLDGTGDVYVKIIDFGLVNISNNFFLNDNGWGTVIYKNNILFTGCLITSPLYDLGCVCYSIFENLIEVNSGIDFYTHFNLTDTNITNIPSDFVFTNFQRIVKVFYESLYYNMAILSNDLFCDKVILTMKLLEILNLFILIKKYYNTKVKPVHIDMSSEHNGISNCVNYHFVAEDIEYIDIDSGEKIRFEGQDYDLYKNIIFFVLRKLDDYEKRVHEYVSNPKYGFILGLTNNMSKLAKYTEASDLIITYDNPTRDMFTVIRI